MHKWLALCLMCVMSYSMVTCQLPQNSPVKPFATPESNVTGQLDNEPIQTESSDTTHSTGLQWEIREVVEPTVNNVQAQYFTVHEEIKAGVVISPWQPADFSIDRTKNALQSSQLLKGWALGRQVDEIGHVTEYDKIGQMTGYQVIHSIIGAPSEDLLMTGTPQLSVEYHENTETTIGYTDILFRFNIPEENITKDVQSQMHQMLRVVYGEEYAEFLCYAPNVEGSLLLEIKQENAKIHFRRNITPSGIIFSVQVVSRLGDTIFLSFPGNKEHIHITDISQHIYEFISPEIGDINLQDYRNIGAKMLQSYFHKYNGTISDYASSYTMQILLLDNGRRIISFALNAMVSQKGVERLISPDFMIEYQVMYDGENIVDANFTLKCSTGQKDATMNIEAARDEFTNAAAHMLRCIMKDDVSTDGVFTCNEDGAYQPYQYKTNIFGMEKNVTILFDMGATMADKLVGYIYYTID